ncbi:hypothetical protein VTN77DRAFT_5942 [Rasamsonia byssochlamydoides]|uniref:uncharacterized protein n=1 Tax=Rasamsonia byssochlamydoides TaxID=89139 RepID=UPI003742CFE7
MSHRRRIPMKKKLAAAKNETAFIVHTSGSTGFPKPMYMSHDYISRAARNIGLQVPEGYEMLNSMTGNNQNVLLLPLGHPEGVHFGVLNPFFNKTTVILPLPGIPPTGEALLEMLQHTQADWATLAPLTLETISKNMTLLEDVARHLKMLLFSGGSLPKVFGDVIASKIKLTSLLGSSESGPLPTMYRHGYDFEQDWNYLQIHPAIGARFDPLPGDVFELVFDRTPESEPHQTVFTIYPDLKEFRTKDLLTPHPSLPDVWTHAARSDDVIVFLNGEKVNPVTFESHVAKHPEVAAAVMFGHQRFEPGLLIELRDEQKKPLSTVERARIIERLWPTIEAANRLLPAYAQVSQSHICFTDPGSPVLRTLKGSLRRQATLDHYASKINQVYADVEAMWTSTTSSLSKGDLATTDSIRGLVRESLVEATRLENVEDNADLFSQGIDSLHILRLVRQLRIKTGLHSIQPSIVYLHPSIAALAEALYALAHKIESSETEQKEKWRAMRTKTLQKYLDMITSRKDGLSSKPGDNDTTDVNTDQVVILTGSTGSIGSYILHTLLSQPQVKRVYCLNRSPDSGTLQKERNTNLDPILPTSSGCRKNIDWLPIDTLAKVVVNIGLHAAAAEDLPDPETEPEPVVVLHPLNPHRTSWEALVPSIITSLQQHASPETTIEIVSPAEWLAKLRASAVSLMQGNDASEEAREALLRANPALRLLDFFAARFGSLSDQTVALGGLQWETSRAESLSEKLRAAEAIDGVTMKRWVEQWLRAV